MLRYYSWLAGRSLRRNPALTALMVLAIGLGIASCITTLTVLRALSGDPMPTKSERLFVPQFDPRDMNDYQPGAAPAEQLTYPDGVNLLKARRAKYQALMSGGSVVIQPEDPAIDAYIGDARYTSADFFPMFETPFASGSGWSATDDEAHARVAVISKALNDKLSKGEDSVGRTLRLRG
ncbi:MAG TPA: ABC transporter permease, partial [Fontimonas sp.]